MVDTGDVIRPGSTLGNYRLESLLGEGGFGQVYRATQLGAAGLSRPVAVKLLRQGLSDESAKAFTREARIIANLQHRNIVQIVEFGWDQGVHFLVMELVDGITVKDLMQVYPRVPLWAAVTIGVMVARALQYAHDQPDEAGRPLGIVHRDVKPANIMLNRQGDVKLSDFGLAKMSLVRSDQVTQIGVIKGTPAYMSPEQREGRPISGTADVYALGKVIYECVTGVRLAPIYQFSPPTPAPSKYIPEAPPELDEHLLRCLRVDPFERPTSRQLGRGLQTVLAELLPAEKLSALNDELARLVDAAIAKVAVSTVDVVTDRFQRLAAPLPEPGSLPELVVRLPPTGPQRMPPPPGAGEPLEDSSREASVLEDSSRATVLAASVERQLEDSDLEVELSDSDGRHPTTPYRDRAGRGAGPAGEPSRVDRSRSRRAASRGDLSRAPARGEADDHTRDIRTSRKRRRLAALIGLLAAALVIPAIIVVAWYGHGGGMASLDADVAAHADAGSLSLAAREHDLGRQHDLGPPDLGSGPDLRPADDLTSAVEPPPDLSRGRRGHKRRPRPPVEKPAPKRPLEQPAPQAGAGTLSVNTEPWAVVYLDGGKLGTTPLFQQRVPAGQHVLRLVSPKGRAVEVRITIAPGRHRNLGVIRLSE